MAIRPPSRGEFEKMQSQVREAIRLASRHDPDLMGWLKALEARIQKLERRLEKLKQL